MQQVDDSKLVAAEMQDKSWSPMKLVVLGLSFFFVAMFIIISLGSRIGGCMYLDGAH